jgi:hypothetical protein
MPTNLNTEHKGYIERIKRNPIQYIKIALLIVVLVCSLDMAFGYIEFNTSVSSTLMKGNLSDNDKTIGEGLVTLFSPVFAIAVGIALLSITLLIETFSEIDLNEKMYDLQVKTLKTQYFCVQILKKIDPTSIPIDLDLGIIPSTETNRKEDSTPTNTGTEKQGYRYKIWGAILLLFGAGGVIIEIITFFSSSTTTPTIWTMYSNYYLAFAPGVSLAGLGIAIYALGISLSSR